MSKLLGYILILCCCILREGYSQESLTESNQKKIEELRARLSNLDGTKKVAAENCSAENDALKQQNKVLQDSITALNEKLNAHPDIVKISENVVALPHCDCKRIFYALGKITTDYKSHPELDSLVQVLKASKNMAIKIVGHSDRIGVQGNNQSMGLKRAEDLKAYLIKNLGVSPALVRAEGHGNHEHIAENADHTLYYLDSRVEIALISL